jgi:hypothetical protein
MVAAVMPIHCVLFGQLMLTLSNLCRYKSHAMFRPTIYRNRGTHANHYTTDAVPITENSCFTKLIQLYLEENISVRYLRFFHIT